MPFYFKPRVSVISLIFVLLFFRLSYWQWQRYQLNSDIASTFHASFNLPVADLDTLVSSSTPDHLEFRRVAVSGTYDYSHELILANRGFEDLTGAVVITPFKLKNSDRVIMVSRGFVPLSNSDQTSRKIFQRDSGLINLTGIIRFSSQRYWLLQPADPEPVADGQWIDKWLRVDLPKIGRQMPYPILPFFLEVLDDQDIKKIERQITLPKSERDEIFVPKIGTLAEQPSLDKYPILTYEPLVPPGRNLGYVFEWSFLALLAAGMGVVFQLRPSIHAQRLRIQ